MARLLTNHRRRRRQQRQPVPPLEGGLARAGRETGDDPSRVSLPAGDERVERDRAPDVLPHHPELAGPTLVSHEVIIDLISKTATDQGLTIQAELDRGTYPTGIEVTDEQPAAVNMTPNGSTATGTTPSNLEAKKVGN